MRPDKVLHFLVAEIMQICCLIANKKFMFTDHETSVLLQGVRYNHIIYVSKPIIYKICIVLAFSGWGVGATIKYPGGGMGVEIISSVMQTK